MSKIYLITIFSTICFACAAESPDVREPDSTVATGHSVDVTQGVSTSGQNGQSINGLPNELIISPSDFGGIDGRYLSREQLQEIRNHFVADGRRTIIRTIEPSGCMAPGTTFTVNGSGFGDSQGSKSLWLSRRGIDIRAVAIISWSDTAVVARTTGDGLSGTYNVGIKEGGSRYISNVNKDLRLCPVVIGGAVTDVDVGVAPIPLNCFDLDLSRIDLICEDTCKIVDGERIVHDYGVYWGSIFLGYFPYQELFFVIDGEFEQQCLGPVGATWYRTGAADEVGRTPGPIVLWKKDGGFDTRAGRLAAISPIYSMSCDVFGDSWTADVARDSEIRRMEPNENYRTPFWAIGSPEEHGIGPDGAPREFWFNIQSRWNSERDARTVFRLMTEAGIRGHCFGGEGHGSDFNQFRFWTSDP